MRQHATWRGVGLLLLLALLAGLLLTGAPRGEAAMADADTAVLAGVADGRSAGLAGYLPVIRNPPPPPRITLTPFVSGFDTETIMDIAHANDGRLFVVEKEGVIRIVQNGVILPTPFLDISAVVSSGDNWELGMLGLVFHPDFPQVPYFYVSYTGFPSYRIFIERYSVNPQTPNVADVHSMVQIMRIDKSFYNDQYSPVHNAGDMNFGPDGYLYIALGDGGPDPATEAAPGDPLNHGQRTDTLLGKILRIDVDGHSALPPQCGGPNATYNVPPSNPYVNKSGCDEIWLSGFRNPWRFSIDPVTGALFIGDVGEERAEEVNYHPGGRSTGENYGWHCWEGTFDYTTIRPEYAVYCSAVTNLVFPIYEYSIVSPCSSVVGGYVYRGSQYPALVGRYLFADFCSGEFFTVSTDFNGGWVTATASGSKLPAISTFGEDVNGELYVGTGWPPGTPKGIYRVTVSQPTG